MTDMNQELSQLRAEIDETILLVDRAPLHLLDQFDGFSPGSQFIVTTLVPELLDAEINIIGLRFDNDTQVLSYFFLLIRKKKNVQMDILIFSFPFCQSSRIFKVSKKEAQRYIEPSLEN